MSLRRERKHLNPFDENTELNTRRRMNKKQATAATILQLVDFLVDQSENCGLDEHIFTELHTPLAELAKRYEITESQALFLAIFINNFEDHHIRVVDITRHFECKPVKLLNYWNDLIALGKKGYILVGKNDEDFFSVPNDMMVAVRKNEVYQMPAYTNLKDEEFYDRIGTLIGRLQNNTMEQDAFYEEVRLLITKNQQLPCCQVLCSQHINDAQMGMLLITINRLLTENDEHIIGSDVEDAYRHTGELRADLRRIASDTHPLIKDGIIEHAIDDGMAVPNAWRLTWEAKGKLLSGMGIEVKKDDTRGITLPENITEKKLYFRPETQAQVDKLRRLISQDRFKEVQDRLEQNGMRRGVACIFYGGPGTGKTETVLQLARETGRGIMLVDISQMRDKYVGETEKRIKHVFDRYRQLVKEQTVAPILVFNEADALFCKRNENAQDGVDKMENAMQNIILQEMETLEGILIATTNLATSMDSAFERRFLYKVEFQNPTPKEAQHIWKAMLKDLKDEDALALASEFGFSGGQIENIARKHLISSLLDEEELNLEGLRTLCKQETLKKKSGKSVGFAA